MKCKAACKLILSSFCIIFVFLLTIKTVEAEIIEPHPYCTNPAKPACYPERVIYQWTCQPCVLYYKRCDTNDDGIGDGIICTSDDQCSGYDTCELSNSCKTFQSPCPNSPCCITDVDVYCDQGAVCKWTGDIKDCTWIGGSCDLDPNMITYDCCGPGTGGVTPPPGVSPSPLPTDPPPPPPPEGNFPKCNLTACDSALCLVGANVSGSYTVSASDVDGDLSNVTMDVTRQGNYSPYEFYTGSGGGTGSYAFTVADDYYVYCSASDSQSHVCTGDPFCEWEPDPPSALNCNSSGYKDCDGGGDWCAVTVERMPTAPAVLNGPTNACLQVATNLSFSWSFIIGATSYTIMIDRLDGTPWGGCVALGAGDKCETVSVNSYTYPSLEPGYSYEWWVVASNDSCGDSSESVHQTFSMPVCGFSGYVYDDPHKIATAPFGGLCSSGGVTLNVAPGSGQVQARRMFPGIWTSLWYDVEDDLGTNPGHYSVAPVPEGGLYSIRFQKNSPWELTCPGSGALGLFTPPKGDADLINFYVTKARDAWMQTVGGDVFAANGAITNPIPDSCASDPTGVCEPYLSAGSNPGVVQASGTIDVGDGYISTEGWEAEGTGYAGDEYKFAYWLKKAKEAGTDFIEKDCVSEPNFLSGKSGLGGYSNQFVQYSCGNDVTLSSSWKNINNQILTLFVKFDDPSSTLILDPYTGTDKEISIGTNGNLTVITNGNITISDRVNKIQGIYITDGTFSTAETDWSVAPKTIADRDEAADDFQLQFKGTIVAWTGLSLKRDLGVYNNSEPAEKFEYEPAFVNKLPNIFKTSHFTWGEVAP